MIKWLVAIFVVLLVAIFLGVQMHADPGYVLFSFKTWSLETTLWMFFAALFILILFIYVLFWLTSRFNLFSLRARHWSNMTVMRSIRKRTNYGLFQLAEGNWTVAEKALIKAAKTSDAPLINYLAAAHAAQHAEKYDARDEYLRLAHASTKGSGIAVGLTQARLQLHAQQYEQALATLKHLRELAPKHKYVLQLLQQVYLQLKDWQQLSNLLSALRKYKALHTESLHALERQVYIGMLLVRQGSALNIIEKIWQHIPQDLQNDDEILLAYTSLLISKHAGDEAEKLLKTRLKRSWSEALLENYSLACSSNAIKQLATAEGWLKDHDQDAELLLCLGRLCKKQQLWGKAQKYLTACVAIQPKNGAAYYELAQIMEALSNKIAAYDYYRKACLYK
ncbi:MAG: heme biosynthesis protein HemY [Gammaproteobacteria bacterium]|nr:heme biosynthesis protein HemY [Gammaproteobacteria bacterium]